MDGLATPAGMAGRAAAKNAPTIIDWIRTRFNGRRVAVIGPPAVGKSCFAFYVQSGELRPEEYTHRATLTTTARPMETIPIGAAGRFKVRIRQHTELPGQLTGPQIAEQLVNTKPDVLIIYLDQSKGIDEARRWLLSLQAPLRDSLFTVVKKHRIKKLIVVANKDDKPKELPFEGFASAIQGYCDAIFRGALDPSVLRRARVMRGISVRNDIEGHRLIEDVLREIMESD